MTKPKILVVDDDQMNVELLDGILSTEYEVIKASSGIDAFIKLEKTLPDLILLDIMMPNMNGYVFCRQVKNNIKTMAIPVLMITALNGEEDKMNAIEAGADDFLSKPIDISDLNMRVKSLLNTMRKNNIDSTSSNMRLYKVF